MATLEIDFNCMCMYVPGKSGAMHVLLPKMGHHTAHDAHAVVLAYHDMNHCLQVVPMEHWELIVDGTTPRPTLWSYIAAIAFRNRLVNLSDLTKKPVDPQRVTSQTPDGVVSRITLRKGRITRVDAQWHVWRVKGAKYRLAHRVTWRVENVPLDLLWQSLGTSASMGEPLDTLASVRPESPRGPLYKLSVHHVLKEHVPPNPSNKLKDSELREHFKEYFKLMDFPHPGDDLLPFRTPLFPRPNSPAPPSGTHYCKSSQGILGT